MNATFNANHSACLTVGRLKAFSSVDRAAQMGMWIAALGGNSKAIAWCRDNGLNITRAAGEGTGPDGGYLVPSELHAEIIALRETYGTFRKFARVVPMTSGESSIPRRTDGLTAYFPGEGGQITELDLDWSSVNLTARKLAVLTRSSTELAEDALADLGEFFASEIAHAFAQTENSAAGMAPELPRSPA